MRSTLCALALLLAAGPAAAQMRGMTAKPYTPPDSAGGQSDEARAVDLAFQLATYGRANNDADALLSAARILINTSYQISDQAPVTAAATGMAATSAVAAPSIDPADLIAEARQIDASVATRADALGRLAAARTQRGATVGPTVGSYRIDPYQNQTFTWRFAGGEIAEIGLQGSGYTDIDCAVSTSNGNVVGYDLSYSDTCYISWYVPYTQTYTIQLSNLGGTSNPYVFATN